MEDNLHMGDSLVPGRTSIKRIDMGEMVNYIFHEMIAKGYAPSESAIYEVLMLQSEFIAKELGEDDNEDAT